MRLSLMPGAMLALSCGEAAPLDPLDLVPPDAAVVGQANVQSLRSSPLLKRWMRSGEAGRSIDVLGSDCGTDPVPRIERVTFTMLPSGMSRGEFALLVEGRIDPADVLACGRSRARRKSATLVVEEWSGVRVMLGEPDTSGAIALPEGGPIVVGERSLVRRILRQRARRDRSIRSQTAVMQAWEALGARRSARAVVRPPPDLRQEARGRFVPTLASLADAELVAVGVQVASDLGITAMARLANAGLARKAARAVRRQIDAAADDPVVGLTPFAVPLQSLEVEARGGDVVFGLTVTERQIDQLARELEAR